MYDRERPSLTSHRPASVRVRPLAWLLGVTMLAVLPAATCTVPETESPGLQLSQAVELEPVARPDPRPIRMTARDGTDLPLTNLEIHGSVEDPLAFTELRLDFENREPRSLDATLEVRLPPEARVTRFAALIEGSWREAEVVERSPGPLRPSLHDPAQLAIDPDPDGDQHFFVTLPDIPGGSVQKVILSYTETFPAADSGYRVRVGGLHDIDRVFARVVVHSEPEALLEVWAGNDLPKQLGMDEFGRRVYEELQFDWSLTDDFVVPTSGQRRIGVRNGRKVVFRVNPLTHDHAAPIDSLTILFDTSASRAVGYEARVEELAALIEALPPQTGPDIGLRLIAFDQGIEEIYEGPLDGIERAAFDRLQARRALGASNLTSVLRHVGTIGAKVETGRSGPQVDDDEEGWGGRHRVVLISDGMATAGLSERSRILDAVADLREAGVARFDVIADDGRCDAWTLRTMVRQLDASGLVLDAGEGPTQLVRRLVRTVHDDVKIIVPDARWFYPEVVHGVQSDDDILVYADVESLSAGIEVEIVSDGKTSWIVPLVEVEEPLVGRALDYGRVEHQVETLEKAGSLSLAARKQVWRKIVSNSKLNRVVNDYTRLTMLSDRGDYERAQLDPSDLPGVLVAGPFGADMRKRVTPTALVEDDIPLARERMPEFPRESLGVDQLLILAQEDVSAGPSGLSSAEADAIMLVGELVEPPPPPLPVQEPMPGSPAAELARMVRARPSEGRRRTRARANPPERKPEDAYAGNLLTIMNLIEWGEIAQAKEVAWRWRQYEPTEVLAVIAVGEAFEASAELETGLRADAEIEVAARAYGSIIDLYPDRADMRRFAGTRLEHLGSVGTRLAIDTYRRARQQRPDHPSSHRLLAFAHLRAGSPERAFDVLEAGLRRDWNSAFSGAFTGVERVLREDLSLILAAWLAAEPDRRAEILERAELVGVTPEAEPSLRFVLTWETGGNDVDLHVRDGLGSHAYYDSRGLRTGGALYYDVTDGYGPEVFTVIGEPTGYPYNLQVHYYALGPNGYGMGKVQIVEHDGGGRLAFDERPFMVMKDRAFVDLGDLMAPLFADKAARAEVDALVDEGADVQQLAAR